MIVSLFLLAVALIVNASDKKMLALCLAVSAGVFLPMPKTSWELFYISCIGLEICVAYIAWRLRCAASNPIVLLSAILVICHAAGMALDGYPALSAYRILIPVLEKTEFVFCILLSSPVLGLLHNHESPPV